MQRELPANNQLTGCQMQFIVQDMQIQFLWWKPKWTVSHWCSVWLYRLQRKYFILLVLFRIATGSYPKIDAVFKPRKKCMPDSKLDFVPLNIHYKYLYHKDMHKLLLGNNDGNNKVFTWYACVYNSLNCQIVLLVPKSCRISPAMCWHVSCSE